MIARFIGERARRAFSRAMTFEEGGHPELPAGTASKDRLLYLHIPFCEKLCPYCSFNRVVFVEPLARNYFQALRKEIDLYRERGYDFSGIYVGGGTPTVQIDELKETLLLARANFDIREISVETNPNHLTTENVRALREAGVNRLSVGVQSFDDGLLRAMDRYEKYGSGSEIAGRLKDTLGAFDTLNADMIFNFATQTPEILARDLETLIDIGIDQITYYPLMVSDSTREKIHRTLGPVDTNREERFYRRITARLIPPYHFSSVWCFSRKPAMIDEYVVGYDEYAGLGSGSIGYMGGTCYANTFSIEDYIRRLDAGEIPLMAARRFGTREQVQYDFLMKLFGTEVTLGDLRKKYGNMLGRHLWPMVFLSMLAGAVHCSKGRLSLTPRGRYFWVVMMREFFIAVNNFRDFCRGYDI